MLRGAKLAGKTALRAGATGAVWARDHGSDLIDQIPVDEIEGNVRGTVIAARERIDGMVRHELRDLRRTLRQQRTRFGI